MRYSRVQQGGRHKKKKNCAPLIIVAVLLGVTAYLVGAGVAGGWLAENVINPVFNNEKTTAKPSPQSPGTAANETQQALPIASSLQEEKIKAQNIALYTLQSGAFADNKNAKAAADELIARGAAGYIAFDGNLYRTLIAGYINESDAASVKKELSAQGVICSVFLLESGALEFKISAEQQKIDAVKACFTIVPDTVNSLMQIIYDCDKGQNVDERIAVLKDSANATNATLRNALSSDNDVVARIGGFMNEFCRTLGEIPNSNDVPDIAFSSSLKYNIISIVVKYSSFIDEISG